MPEDVEIGPALTKASNHWYDRPTVENLRQGDLFIGLTAFWLPEDLSLEPARSDQFLAGQRAGNWIVASPSCDLDTARVTQALLVEVIEASPENVWGANTKQYSQTLEVLRRDLDPSKFLLPSHSDVDLPLSFAHVRDQVLLPINYLQSQISRRMLRLKHPFREKFGNWIGSRFSDVGPENYTLLPKYYDKGVFPPHVLRANEDTEAGD